MSPPTAKPAMWAQNATPPVIARVPSEPTPLNSSIRNQMPRKKIAGISIMSMKNTRKTTVSTRECG